MATFNDSAQIERQLSSLLRAEAGQATLPLGTWKTISPKLGQPDRPGVFWRLRNAFSYPHWRNPMNTRYVAPAATLLLVLIAAMLFVLLINDDADENDPVPAASPTALPEPTATALRFDPTQEPTSTAIATITPIPSVSAEPSGIRTVVAQARDGIMQFSPSAFDGEHLWIPEQSFVAKIDLEGNRVGSFQVARNQVSSMTVHDGFLWVLDRGEREVRKVTLTGETVGRYQAGDVLGISSRNGEGIWSFSPSSGMIKHDSDWEVVEQVAVPTDPGTIQIAEEFFWLWVGSTLYQFSYSGEEVASWSVPQQPEGEPNRTDDVQVKGGYVWLTGYSRTEITRLDPSTGETMKISLPVYDGEYESNGVIVTHPTALVTDDAVWVAYMRYGEAELDPSEAGLIFGESSFRRLSVFDHDGQLLREEIIVKPGEPERSFQLLFPVPLQPIRQLNDEVWIGVGAQAGATVFKVFVSDFLDSAS